MGGRPLVLNTGSVMTMNEFSSKMIFFPFADYLASSSRNALNRLEYCSRLYFRQNFFLYLHHHVFLFLFALTFVFVFAHNLVFVFFIKPKPRELPPRPRDRESMKRQQSVEVNFNL